MGKSRKQRQPRQTTYTGPLHEEQYLAAIEQAVDAGVFKPGRFYEITVVHDEDNDGEVVGLLIEDVPAE